MYKQGHYERQTITYNMYNDACLKLIYTAQALCAYIILLSIIFQITINILQSIILGWLTDYFVNPKTPESTKNAFLMALMIVLIGFGNALCCTWEYDFALQSGELISIYCEGFFRACRSQKLCIE